MARESGARNEKWGSGGPGTKQLGTKEQGTGNRAQKVSKSLVLYRQGPIGSNPIGGGKSTIELFGFMRSAPGECNGCNRHADRVVLKNTDMPGFDGQANPEHIAVFVVVEHSFAESVVVLQGKKQIDFATGLPGHFEFGICVEVPSSTFGDACRDPESVVIADVAAGDHSIAFVTDNVGIIFEGQGNPQFNLHSPVFGEKELSHQADSVPTAGPDTVSAV